MDVRLGMTWARWLAVLAGWTVLSIFFAPELYLFFVYRKENIPWNTAMLLTLANTGIATLLLPGIVWLAVRCPLGRGAWRRGLAVHIPACFLFSIVHSGLYALLCYASPVFHVLFTRFHPNLLTYWAVIGFVEALRYFQAYKERDRQLAQAQLELLKAQLQPHFLFNTLNTISAMMHEDVAEADRMLNRLSELLRMTLDNIGRHETPLRNEIAFAQKYIEIENIRFGGGIRLESRIDPDALDAVVPNMMLQPLVENSIRHGFLAHAQTGTVRIEAMAQHSRLTVRVVDNGAGLARQSRPGGTGLPNTRARLEQLYSGSASFRLISGEKGGAIAEFSVPLRFPQGDLSVKTHVLGLPIANASDHR